jgi:hypothetical protein
MTTIRDGDGERASVENLGQKEPKRPRKVDREKPKIELDLWEKRCVAWVEVEVEKRPKRLVGYVCGAVRA